MHTTAARALLAAHAHSPASTSSSVMGVLTIASQVRCTCMRENAENSDSKVAAYMVAEAAKPAARKAKYDVPPISPSSAPSP